jgi:sporulation protein YabP
MDKKTVLHSFVNVKERRSVTLDGIINVEKFDDCGVSLISECGRIEIEGEGLKIVSLEKNGGIIEICGKIDGFFYEREKTQISLFKKIFG